MLARARSPEHAGPAGEPGAHLPGNKDAARRLLERTAVDAGEPADGAPGRARRRGRRRHDVGARRTRRHDPQAAATAATRRSSRARIMRRDRQRQQQGQGQQQLGDLQPDQQGLREAGSTSCWSNCASAASAIPGSSSRARAGATWSSSAAPAKPWARRKANSVRATPKARSTARAARSMRCARARRGWRSQMQRKRPGHGTAACTGQPGRNGRARAQQDTDPLGAADARARIWRRRHREGAGRDRRPARPPHPGRTAQALRRECGGPGRSDSSAC